MNPVQTAVLYGLAVDAAKLTGNEVVLDAYCGIGTIGLTAADKAKQVVGVELNRDAVHDAIGNAKHNGVKNARFFAADATEWISAAAAAGGAGRRHLHGSAPRGLDPAVHRERRPHGPEAGGLRQLQPGDHGPGPRPPDEKKATARKASPRSICSRTVSISRWSAPCPDRNNGSKAADEAFRGPLAAKMRENADHG